MRILITGATGFVGGHLAEALLARGGCELHGLAREPAWPADWSHLTDPVRLHSVDLLEADRVEAAVRQVNPEQIYHLAGYADPGRSKEEPEKAWDGNLTATLRLYNAVARWGGRARILYVSSGLVYGEPGAAQPFNEQSPLQPDTPYAASKAAADLASYQVTRFPGLDVVRVRPFNHIGPHQLPPYAVANFARQVAAIERGEQRPVVQTRDLSPLRDFTDVRDMVAAYLRLMESGRTGEVYNACQGRTQTMWVVLDRLRALARVPIEMPPAPSQNGAAVTFADASKLRHETGWQPRYSLDQTLADILDYWRGQGG